ncbi:MAG TPA: tetratricopeptide repeat protein [Steroidobacteraceae bacterium]|nr:tetratricopeptide repeat protein [Steroidobacteraceae bacterium]
MLLSACGSSPTQSLPSTATATAAQPETPQEAKSQAVTTAPLKESGASEAKPNKSESASAAAPAAPEPALPPEAVQKFDQAVVHMSAGDTAAAEQAFKTLAATYPTFAGPWINLGILQAKAGRLEDAEKSLQTAIERNSNNATAYNQLGIVYRKLGRFQEADEAYQHAIEADPNYANAYLNLGVLCDLYLQQPQRALEAYEHYLSLAASPDKKVSTWVSELKKRAGVVEQHSGSEG